MPLSMLEPVVGVTSVPVTIEGEWIDRTWQGEIHAEVELVGVVFALCARTLTWTRSRRSDASGFPLEIHLGPADPAWPDTWFHIELGRERLHGRVPVQSLDHIQGAEPTNSHLTGVPFWIARDSTVRPDFGLGLLLLPRAEVTFGRKRIWRLRPRHRDELTSFQHAMLVERRYGEIRT